MRRSNVTGLMAGVMILAAAGQVLAHEMFLRSDSYFLKPQSTQTLSLINGTFYKSENSISRDRMQDVTIVGDGKKQRPTADSWTDANNSSYLKFKTGGAGTYVAGVSTKPKIIEMKAEDFRNYLKHEGVPDTLAAFDKGARPEQVRERYSKHIRAVFQVGDKRSSDYSKALGYPVEIILKNNPYQMKVSDELRFQVLYKGKPVANQFVNASHAGYHGHDTAGGHLNAYQLRTDQNGIAKFKITKPAVWYIALIHMQKASDPEADYESNWATVTFLVK